MEDQVEILQTEEVVKKPQEAKAHIANELQPIFKELNKKEIRKTEEDLQFIKNVESSLERVLGEIGCPKITILPESIHFLPDKDFKKKLGQGDFNRQALYFLNGELYVKKDKEIKPYFTLFLLHEIAHKASGAFSKVIIDVTGKYRTHTGRLGFAYIHIKDAESGKDRWQVKNEGLNEAVTEIFTERMGKYFNEINKNSEYKYITPEARFEQPYYGQVLVIKELIKMASEAEKMDYKTSENQLFLDYISGSDSFLEKINKIKKGATEDLLNMGTTDNDALNVAERLGIREIAEKIKLHKAIGSMFKNKR